MTCAIGKICFNSDALMKNVEFRIKTALSAFPKLGEVVDCPLSVALSRLLRKKLYAANADISVSYACGRRFLIMFESKEG